MSERKGRAKARAILSRDMQRPGGRPRPGGTGDGGPFLPEVGEVYQIVTLIKRRPTPRRRGLVSW